MSAMHYIMLHTPFINYPTYNSIHDHILQIVLVTIEDIINVGECLVINPSERYSFKVDVMKQMSSRDNHLFESKAGRNITFAARILHQADGVRQINCAERAIAQKLLNKILIA